MNFRTADRKLTESTQQKRNAEEAARQVRNAYYRQWRANNRDKVKRYNADYWARKAAKNGEEIAAEGG